MICPNSGRVTPSRCTSGWLRATASAPRSSKGVVIARNGSGLDASFTVRKVSFGVGVERVFPENAPIIQKVEVTRRGDVRRSKLYYLRDRVGKAARIKEKRTEHRSSARAPNRQKHLGAGTPKPSALSG